MNGYLIVDKPKGCTSFHVIHVLRKLSGEKKIGHGGTLDPMVTGVLPVFFGSGAKAISLLPEHDKTYEAVITLGASTDTEDASGNVVEEREVRVTDEEVIEAVNSFVGPYEQVPPMLSSKWQDGKRLYSLFRQGKTVERKAVPVEIYSIEDVAVSLPDVSFTVTCSSGTYVRTLAKDVGEKLGTLAHLKSLKRTRSGRFSISDAKTLDELKKAAETGVFSSFLTPVERLFEDLPVLTVNADADRFLQNGNELFSWNLLDETLPEAGARVRVRFFDGTFAALYTVTEEQSIRPVKMFPGEES